MSVKPGDVVLLLSSHSDLLTAKRRPALVVQSDKIDTGIPQKIVALIASNSCVLAQCRYWLKR